MQRPNSGIHKITISQANGIHGENLVNEKSDNSDGLKISLNTHDSGAPHVPAHKKAEGAVYDIPAGATTADLPPGVLYKVSATFKYVAEDADELAFEAGEIIQVVPYEDPEEQEDGWLMGIKESTGQKGLFPANFTRPI
ncbi:myc box-dependent-interacting protein 1-like protein [Leptotrombidium deliense]|uniref:Myc box-dependent-interacting protein 1-like protein n=1 Tax=Leptotrombidium deliense TaxID=299467 RepID=A0A443SK95_9ACAR|nr:myc box-dependent-interacting protein 1-like protein [Leptotrombidium deliense]